MSGRPQNPLDRFTSGGWVRGILRFGLGVALVVVVMRFVGGDSWGLLNNPKLLPVIAGGALIHLLQRVARIRKWQLMIAPSRVMQRPFSYLLRIQLIGMVANLALPVSEAIKVWAVSANRSDAVVGAKSIVIDLSMHTALVGLVGVVSAAALGLRTIVVWAVALVMLLAPLIVMAAARRWPKMPKDSGVLLYAEPLLWGLAGVETICQVGIYVLAFSAIGVPLSVLSVLALAPVLYIVDLLNFTPSGLGLREALFAGVSQVAPEVSADVGVAVALVISSMLIVATLAGGGLALLFPAPADAS